MTSRVTPSIGDHAAAAAVERPRDEIDDYRRALDLHAIVSITDPRGVILYANERFAEISGYPREELVGRTHRIVNSGRHPPGFFAAMWRAIASGRPWRGEICNRARDGALYWVDSLIFPVIGRDGRPARYVSVRFDVTPYRRALSALDDVRARLREVTELSRVGGWSYTPGAAGPEWDEMTFRLHEAPADHAPTLDEALAFYPPEARPRIAEAVEGALVRGRAFDIEAPFVSATGREMRVRAIGRPVFEDGQIVRVAGVIQDVTERHLRDAAVARLQARFEAIVRNTPVAITLRDRMGTIHLANARFEALAGRRNLPGLSEEDLFPETVAEAHRARDQAALATGEPTISEDVYPGPDGRDVTLLTSRFLIDDAVLGEKVVCAIAADITEQKRLQQSLVEARAAAEAATRAKADFLSAVSHEIRAPLNGVLGMAEKLSRTPLDADQRAALEVIRDSGALLLALVNDLLDHAKIERGALTVEAIPFDPVEAVRRVLPAHAERAAAKGLALDLAVSDAAHGARIGDPMRLKQIVHNLVGNAIKFTGRGAVRVSLDADDGGALVLTVADDGIGMTAEQAGRVFDGFSQADPSIARRFGGTGLGLSIVKGLAEAMGGAVSVESAPGAGSTFRVRLPLPPAPGDAPSAADPATGRPLRVLAADDSEINRAVLAAFLEPLGVEAVIVDGGQAAVEAARSGDFDLLLLDVMMTDLDGPDALRTIREEAEAAGRPVPPAIAVTGHGLAEDVAACCAAGFAGHLPKPVSSAALAETLRRFAPASA